MHCSYKYQQDIPVAPWKLTYPLKIELEDELPF